MRLSGLLGGLNARAPVPIVVNAPGVEPGLGDDNAPALRHCDKMLEDERGQPRKRLFGIADRAIFVRIGIFHEDRAGAVRAQLWPKAPVVFPCALIVAADLRPALINAAASRPGLYTVLAELARWFWEFGDLQNFAAQRAFAAGLTGDLEH